MLVILQSLHLFHILWLLRLNECEHVPNIVLLKLTPRASPSATPLAKPRKEVDFPIPGGPQMVQHRPSKIAAEISNNAWLLALARSRLERFSLRLTQFSVGRLQCLLGFNRIRDGAVVPTK